MDSKRDWKSEWTDTPFPHEAVPTTDIEKKGKVELHPWFRILVVSVGFMTDAYDLFIFGIVSVIMGKLNPNDATTVAKTVLGISIIVGTMLGQAFFGIFGDMFGRKAVFFLTLSLVIVMALLSAFSFDIDNTYWISLTINRVVLGFGIGGEYPLSATIAAESAPPKRRGCVMATVFSMQGIGNFLAPCVVGICLGFKMPLEAVWRVSLGFGCIPALLIIYWRSKLEETHVNVGHKPAPMWLIKKYWFTLVGTSMSWFLFDIAFYGNGFFKDYIINLLGLAAGDSVYDTIVSTTISSLLMATIALPGYWCSIGLMELVGRRPIQLFGFAGEAVVFFVLGALFNDIVAMPTAFIILYGLTFFFSNLGPNTTTYVLAAECFPTNIRSTCHGLSAAAGKAGALLGTAVFPGMVDKYGVGAVFYLCGVVLVLGFIITFVFVPETKGTELAPAVFEAEELESAGSEEVTTSDK